MTQRPWFEKGPSVDTLQNRQNVPSEGFAGDLPRDILDACSSQVLTVP